MNSTPATTYAFMPSVESPLPVRVLKSPLFWVLALLTAAAAVVTLMYTGVLDKSGFHIVLSADLAFLALCVTAVCFKRLLYEVTFIKLLFNKNPWWSEITPQIYLGAIPLYKHENDLRSLGITHYISLTEDFEMEPSLFGNPLQQNALNLQWLHLPTPDFSAVSERDQKRAVSWIHEKIQAGGKVYVHCKGGKGRSAQVVARYLLTHGGHTKEGVVSFLQAKRPQVHLNPKQRAGLLLPSST